MSVQRDHLRHGDESAFQVPERIPVFPLPNVVLFPKTYLPLHIFEPRYREMVADAADQGQCIGMALLKEGWEGEYYRNPAIFPIGCVGRLVSLQPLEDGRSNILLYGIERYEIVQEFYEKSYREAAITIKRPPAGPSLDPALRTALVESARAYLGREVDDASWRDLFDAAADTHDDSLVNGLSCCLDFTPLEKQFLLESESLRQQVCRLRDLIVLKTAGPQRTES
jgi:Lon protease-like protein